MAVLLAGLLIAAMVSLLTGTVWLDPSKLFSTKSYDAQLATLILVELRLPRTILGIAVGAALGISGAALQGLTRNPLAEPGLLGMSTGASLGAVLAIYFGLSSAVQ